MGPKYLPAINNKKKSENALKDKGNTNELIISSFKPKKLPAVKQNNSPVPAIDKNDERILNE